MFELVVAGHTTYWKYLLLWLTLYSRVNTDPKLHQYSKCFSLKLPPCFKCCTDIYTGRTNPGAGAKGTNVCLKGQGIKTEKMAGPCEHL